MQRFFSRTAGNVLLEGLLGAFAIVLVMGWLGPQLDLPSRGYASYGPIAPAERAAARGFDADARAQCFLERGDNAGYVVDAHGAVVCTDKHGRRAHHHPVTIAIRPESR